MFATVAQRTLSSRCHRRPECRSSLLDETPNHDAIEEALREIARAEARAHVRFHGTTHHEAPNDIGRMAHVLAILKERSLCGAVADAELRRFTEAYWTERTGYAEFLELQFRLFR
jgi:hypothetical protein